MKRVIVSRAARSDLVEIWEYIASENIEAADRVRSEIRARFEMLLKFPEIGRRRDELKKGLRSFPVERYLVFYFVTKSDIRIARVLHGARDIESIFKE
ncbi:MAG TPA: type II toxin-antitoxin system RelE/ParE family toxin [Blastocatellia bacterium]|jgi:toxin ParE1/3/4